MGVEGNLEGRLQTYLLQLTILQAYKSLHKLTGLQSYKLTKAYISLQVYNLINNMLHSLVAHKGPADICTRIYIYI